MSQDYTQVTPWLNIPSEAVPYYEEALAIIKRAVPRSRLSVDTAENMARDMANVRIGLGAAFAYAMAYMERDRAQEEMNNLSGAVVAAIEHNEKIHAMVAASAAINRAKEAANE